MAYEQRDLTGSLFKNTRKETETHPDYNGSALIGGVSYFLDAWINTAKDGSKYMSLKMKPKGERRVVEDHKGNVYDPATPQPAFDPADLDDDVPF